MGEFQKNIISKLKNVDHPIEKARGLANEWYLSPQLIQEERNQLLCNEWAAIGFAHDVPETGSLYPLDFMGFPLLMLRDREGKIRVFHNVCRHRGMILVDAPCKSNGVIRCPYHSWAYDLNGRLKRTPHIGGMNIDTHPDFDPETTGLAEVSSAEILGAVLINLSGTAPDFEQWVKPVKDRWFEFMDIPLYPHEKELGYDLQTNWKLAIENYCEAYHLPWIHPGLNSYSNLKDHYNIVSESYAGQGSIKFTPMLDDSGRGFPTLAHLDKKWQSQAEYLALFPNILLGVHEDHSFALIILPQSHNRTIERGCLFYYSADALADDYKDMRQKHFENWDEVFTEDVGVVQGMQRGRHSPGFDGGHFSPVMDTPTHCFHKWCAKRLLDEQYRYNSID